MDEEQQRCVKLYYKSFFPVNKLFKWLKIGENREISLGLFSGSYLRFLTFNNPEEFHEKLLKVTPQRIDVGAVYETRPMKHNNPRIVEKELVFDIDLTDYPRTCCLGKFVCEKCFVLVKAAVEILDYSLREEFGFKEVRFVFSGRRGVHCWVTDDVARRLNDVERGEIVKYYDTVIEKKIYPEEYSRILMKHYSFITPRSELCEDVSMDVLFNEMYLRLDKEVTQKTKHLIKMPFSVHPETKMISVPIDQNSIDDTKLKDFPRLQDVLEQPLKLTPYLGIMDAWFCNTSEGTSGINFSNPHRNEWL